MPAVGFKRSLAVLFLLLVLPIPTLGQSNNGKSRIVILISLELPYSQYDGFSVEENASWSFPSKNTNKASYDLYDFTERT